MSCGGDRGSRAGQQMTGLRLRSLRWVREWRKGEEGDELSSSVCGL